MDTDKQGDQGGEIVIGRHGGELRPIRESARASELARRRWDKRAAAARQGLRDAAAEMTKAVDGKAGLTLPDGSPLQTEYDVVRVVTAAHAMNAADPSAPSSVQSLNAVDRMAFPAPEKATEYPALLPGGLQINLSPQLARELLDELRKRRTQPAAFSGE